MYVTASPLAKLSEQYSPERAAFTNASSNHPSELDHLSELYSPMQALFE
jgi:hypothetical protein